MADEMRWGIEDLGDVVRVPLEVHAPVRRRSAEATAIDQQQAVVLRERSLVAPGLLAPAEAAVYEDGRIALAPDRDVEAARGAHASSLQPPQLVAVSSN